MRILAVAPVTPFPPSGGGHLRLHHLLRALAIHHEVTLVSFTYGEALEPAPFPIEVVTVPLECSRLYKEMMYGDGPAAEEAYALLSRDTEPPFFVSYLESAEMENTLRQVGVRDWDLILIITTQMARFLPCLPNAPKILDLWNVEALVARRAAQAAPPDEADRAAREADRMLRFERDAASQCALCLAVSGPEAAAARRLLGATRVRVVPNGVDTTQFTPDEGNPVPNRLLFVGTMNYSPNIEAARFFSRDVLPLIEEAVPGAELHIVGAKPTEEVRRLASQQVIIHGGVPDMRPFYRHASVVVVPLLQGGGTRLKILEAAACGKAIVSTALGAEGLRLVPGRDLVIADSARDFARAVIDLAQDGARCRELGRCARKATRAYDWRKIGVRVCRIVNAIPSTFREVS